MEALMEKLKKMKEEGLIRWRQKEAERRAKRRQLALFKKQRQAEERKRLAALNESIARILRKEETKKMLGGRSLKIVLKQCDAGHERKLKKDCNFLGRIEVAGKNSLMKGPFGGGNSMIDTCNLALKMMLEMCDSPRAKSKSLKDAEVKAETDSQVGLHSVKILLERCDSPAVKNKSPHVFKVNSQVNERIHEIETNSSISKQQIKRNETLSNNNILKTSNSAEHGAKVMKTWRYSSHERIHQLPTTSTFDDNGCENDPQLDFCEISSSSSDSCFNTFQPKKKILSDFNGVKLANISVVLDDLFSKNSAESSEIKVCSDKSFPCTYSKGAFKLVSEKQIGGVARIDRKSKGMKKRCDKLFSSTTTSCENSSKNCFSRRKPFKPL